MDLLRYPHPALPSGACARISGRAPAIQSSTNGCGGPKAFAGCGGLLMARSPLFGRRIHIAGSVSTDPMIASTADVEAARTFVQGLSQELVRRGATFVLPLDAEKPRPSDGLPICFDWLIWQTLHASLASRPTNAPDPIAVAVQHHKNEDQVPPEFEMLWDDLRDSD